LPEIPYITGICQIFDLEIPKGDFSCLDFAGEIVLCSLFPERDLPLVKLMPEMSRSTRTRLIFCPVRILKMEGVSNPVRRVNRLVLQNAA
jgi:hypothetical protein